MLLTHLLAGLHLGFVAALPALKSEQSCTEPTKRVEWRELPSSQQQSYIDAVLCLKTKPSRIGLNTSLYDDFAFVHARYNQESKSLSLAHKSRHLNNVFSTDHNVAGFLPWHRYFTHVYEGALQECQYTGSATWVFSSWSDLVITDAKNLAIGTGPSMSRSSSNQTFCLLRALVAMEVQHAPNR